MHLTGEPIDDFKTVYDRFAQAYNLATARDEFSTQPKLPSRPAADRLLWASGRSSSATT